MKMKPLPRLSASFATNVKMQRTNSSGVKRSQLVGLAALAMVAFGVAGGLHGAEPSEPPAPAAFAGEKTTWHGFDRYDFIMDSSDLSLRPFKAPAGENSGVGSPPSGQRRCILVAPKQAAASRPWSWRGCYWDHQPQTEIELLKRGFMWPTSRRMPR